MGQFCPQSLRKQALITTRVHIHYNNHHHHPRDHHPHRRDGRQTTPQFCTTDLASSSYPTVPRSSMVKKFANDLVPTVHHTCIHRFGPSCPRMDAKSRSTAGNPETTFNHPLQHSSLNHTCWRFVALKTPSCPIPSLPTIVTPQESPNNTTSPPKQVYNSVLIGSFPLHRAKE